MKHSIIAVTAVFLACGTNAGAQLEQTASVLDGVGRRTTGGTFTSVTAGAQPGGITVSSGGGRVNYAGFLNTFSLKPWLDTDQDGLENELDPDNDNDTLSDGAEIVGNAFNPVTPTDLNDADSDHDGIGDGEEAAAGTDPTDPGAYLRIVAIERAGSNLSVSWFARSGKSYLLHGADAVALLPGPVIATNTQFGGVAPWFAITNTQFEAVGPATDRAYTIESAP